MKKIMFNDRYGLTEAVLEGRKTMTRRIIPIGLYNQTDWKAVSEGNYEAVSDGEGDWHDIRLCGQYQIGEEVAVAQKYRDLRDIIGDVHDGQSIKFAKGWSNKMFVRADLMPHRIRITNIRVERLQDITDEDCIREGIEVEDFRGDYRWGFYTGFFTTNRGQGCESVWYHSPQKAFAALIDRISGRGTWQRNPWVFVYEFELVK